MLTAVPSDASVPSDPRLNIVSPELREQLQRERNESLFGSEPGYFAPWYACTVRGTR